MKISRVHKSLAEFTVPAILVAPLYDGGFAAQVVNCHPASSRVEVRTEAQALDAAVRIQQTFQALPVVLAEKDGPGHFRFTERAAALRAAA